MPGKHINSKQVEIYMTARAGSYTQETAAARAGMSVRTGRKIEQGKRPQVRRHWRTRTDPLVEVWNQELLPLLLYHHDLKPITLLEHLQECHPGKYSDSLLRTLERRVKEWRALHGPEKEVIFRQRCVPGRQGLSDFTTLKKVIITLGGQPFHHLLYHFRLAFSGWSYMKIILGGESYTAMAEGLQEALWRLGGSPLDHRTDSLSAAFKNLAQNEIEDLTTRYAEFCRHYNMKASRNNRGVGHENGAIESPHGHLKRRIQQSLILRGSNDFATVEEYQEWLSQVVEKHNRRNAQNIEVEKPYLQPLPNYRAIDFTEIVAKVSSSSTIDVRRVTYSVPSRLCGEVLRIHLYHDRLCCFLGCHEVLVLGRIYPTGKNKRARCIDYRHMIKALVRKPQAFRYSQLQEQLLPNYEYKKIWEHIDSTLAPRVACKLMVGILSLAADGNCEAELANYLLKVIANNQPLVLNELQKRYAPIPSVSTVITVAQHALSNYDALMGGCHE